MHLSEEHIISKNHNLWKKCDELTFMSKNLYNYGMYVLKNHLKENNKLLSGFELYHEVKTEDCFKVLPNDTAKEVLFQVVLSYKCFFKALKAWKKNKKEITGCPKEPKFKHKINGRNVLTIPIRNCRLKNNKILFNKHIELELNTKVTNLVMVKIIPCSSCYKINIIYKIEEKELIINNTKLAIDLGVNNICTITNNFNNKPLIINGRGIKSINHYYNKKQAKLQSNLIKNHRKYKSNKLNKLTLKRNNKIKHNLHHVSKKIINYAKQNSVSEIAIGYNKEWKQEINIGKRNNQNFVQIPYLTLIEQIKYKARLNGISILLNEESYTSKTSALDKEEPIKHENYLGKRIKRGLFKSSTGILINSDVNGSIQIGYKVFGNLYRESNIGCVVQPLKVNPL
jgi:putative transposase